MKNLNLNDMPCKYMYVPDQCFCVIYLIIQLGTVFLLFPCILFPYNKGTIAKLRLGIMFNNEIIMFTAAVYSLYII